MKRQQNYDPLTEAIKGFNDDVGDLVRKHKIIERFVEPSLIVLALAPIVLGAADLCGERGFKDGLREAYHQFCMPMRYLSP